MAIPVILTTQSVLGYAQWQAWAFQPYAANSPTYWVTSPLPPGMTLDSVTGRISGAATLPGVYVVAWRAGNADGLSASQLFTIGIDATSDAPPSGLVEVAIDLLTREVSFGSLSAPAPAVLTGEAAAALFAGKSGDDWVFHVVFHRNRVAVELDLDDLRFGAKQEESGAVLVESTEWAPAGTAFRVYCQLVSDALTGALSNAEGALKDADKTEVAAFFRALGEFEWTENNAHDPVVGPATLVSSSRTFRFDLVRELLAP